MIRADAARASHTRRSRSATSSERMDGTSRSSSSGMKRPMTAAATIERPASAQNGPRQPAIWPANAPIGTPTTLAIVRPPITTPSAREPAAGPAAELATTAATDQKAPVASAVSARAASVIAKLGLSAAMTSPSAKTASARTSVLRRDR
jgi:hypothetical protein